MRAVLYPIILSLVFFLTNHQGIAQVVHLEFEYHKTGNPQRDTWVDSVYRSLSLDEQIAQLLMIRTYSNRDRAFYDSISRLIMKYNIGGLTFFQGSPGQQAELTNYWQSVAKTPLLISQDAEWGVGMRLDSVMDFPEQMTLGALTSDSLVFEMGYRIGQQCRRLGVEMNFAPVVDVNNNRNNPVINYRSFGENPEKVARKGAAYIRGLQDAGVIATAKHFPGHGDVDSDSHYTLPVLKKSIESIDSIEFFPFRQAIRSGVGAVMTAHLYVPAIDSTPNKATSLSRKAVTGWLRDSLGFHGLAVTDALDMRGVTKYFRPGDIELMAFLAGNDILLLPLDVPGAISRIKAAIAEGRVQEQELERRCKKILAFKYMAGLNHRRNTDPGQITADLNNGGNQLLKRQIFEQAVTLLKNDHNLLPLKNEDTLKIAALQIGKGDDTKFLQTLALYAPVDTFNVPSVPSRAQQNQLFRKLKDYNLLIVSIENTSHSVSKHYGVSREAASLLSRLKTWQGRLVVDLFGNPYALAYLGAPAGIDALLVSYEDDEVAKEVSAEVIFGAVAASGRLPVTASEHFAAGDGISTHTLDRLKYTIPEAVGIDRRELDTLDHLIEKGIAEGAYPGCEVLFAKNGKVFYHKSFGYFTYDSVQPVKNDDIYDLASLTKIMATTLAVMHLSEHDSMDIDLPLSFYLPYLRSSNKQPLVIREIMTHQARLQAWIPFYVKTIRDFKPDPAVFSHKKKSGYDIPVAEDLFMKNNYRDSIFDTIVSSELREDKSYKYSDLGFYLLYDAIERMTGEPFEQYVDGEFYRPLGLPVMGYKPLDRFPLSRIAPTENDTIFRKQLVRGFVHDPGAAMLGGVSGHAGLFSDASDVAVVMQLLLNGGEYGGRRYFESRTVDEFTRQQFPLDENRRAIGFDKPYPEYDSLGPCCKSASQRSFGHSGFTGTYTWADPDNGLLYVFLSNRVYPDAANRKIVEMDLRTDLHQLMYDILQRNQQSLPLRPDDMH